MMCVLWKQEKSVPNSVVVVYNKVIEYLVRHWKNRELSKTSISHFKEQVALEDVLLKLGKTALHGLVDDSKLIFQENDFESTETLEKGCILGLMTKDCTVNGFDMVTTVSFIHKTFQEYCAALYLSSLAESDQDLCNTYISKMDTKDMEYVLRFSCGMNDNAAKLVLSSVVDQSCKTIEQLKDSQIDNKFYELFGIGYPKGITYLEDKDPWRLPLILLFEAESKSRPNKSIHKLLIPLISSVYLMDSMVKDSEYEKVLQYYVQEGDNLHALMGFVQEVYMYKTFKTREDDCSLSFMILTRLPNLHILTIKGEEKSSLDQVNCTSFLLKIQEKMASSSIKSLDFDHVCECDIAAIKGFLATQPNLTTLGIPRQPTDKPTNVTILGQILQEMSARSGSVTKVTLKGSMVDDLLIQNVSLFCHSLERLAVDTTSSITPVGFQTLFEAMITTGKRNMVVDPHEREPKLKAKSLPLKYLELSDCNIGDSAYSLAEAMVYLKSLAYFDLCNCGLDEKHFHKVGPTLVSMSSNLSETNLIEESDNALSCMELPLLIKLRLDSVSVTSEGAKALSKSLKHMKLLSELDLGGNMIGSHGAKAISLSLQYIPQLTDLDLGNNNIGAEGALALSASLQYIRKLTRLSLHNNNIGLDGAQALSASLQYIPQLTSLYLSNNNIESNGTQALSASLKYTSQLRHLSLNNNNIGSDGAQALSASLQYIPKLSTLYFFNNNIRSDGAQALSASLQYIQGLQMLNLSNNNIGSDGAQALSASFQYLLALGFLYISHNPIGPEGVEAIFKHLHNLISIRILHLRELSGNTINPANECPLLQKCIEALKKSDELELENSSESLEWEDSSEEYWFDVCLGDQEIITVKEVVSEHKSASQGPLGTHA